VGNFVRMAIMSTFDNLFVIPFQSSSIGNAIGKQLRFEKFRKPKYVVSVKQLEEFKIVPPPQNDLVLHPLHVSDVQQMA
jgi:hypothetical protein